MLYTRTQAPALFQFTDACIKQGNLSTHTHTQTHMDTHTHTCSEKKDLQRHLVSLFVLLPSACIIFTFLLHNGLSKPRQVLLQRVDVLVEAQRAHRPQDVVPVDGLTLLALALVARLGRDEAHKLAHALLDRVLPVLSHLGVGRQRLLPFANTRPDAESRSVRWGAQYIQYRDRQRVKNTQCRRPQSRDCDYASRRCRMAEKMPARACARAPTFLAIPEPSVEVQVNKRKTRLVGNTKDEEKIRGKGRASNKHDACDVRSGQELVLLPHAVVHAIVERFSHRWRRVSKTRSREHTECRGSCSRRGHLQRCNREAESGVRCVALRSPLWCAKQRTSSDEGSQERANMHHVIITGRIRAPRPLHELHSARVQRSKA